MGEDAGVGCWSVLEGRAYTGEQAKVKKCATTMRVGRVQNAYCSSVTPASRSARLIEPFGLRATAAVVVAHLHVRALLPQNQVTSGR